LLRFYLDENIDPRVARGLRRIGVPATTTGEAGRLENADSDQLSFAMAKEFVLVTHDAGFLNQTAALRSEGRDHPGLVFIKARKYPLGAIIQKLGHYAKTLSSEQMINQTLFL